MATKQVPAATVREWARSNGMTVGTRGRLDPDVVKAFSKANKGKKYTPKVAEGATITVRVPFTDAKGRSNSKPVTLSTAEARALLGHPKGRRGRFDRNALITALAAQGV